LTRRASTQPDNRGQAEPLAGWPSAGGESLEPLPRVGGSARAGSSRADAWRPDIRGSGSDWDDDVNADEWSYGGRGRPASGHPYESAGDWEGDRDRGRRWSSPEQDYRQDYEGDTW
jgi:hypothetical protein